MWGRRVGIKPGAQRGNRRPQLEPRSVTAWRPASLHTTPSSVQSQSRAAASTGHMALTRRGQASAAGAGGPKAAGVRKPAAKVKAKAKPGAVVTKRLVVRRSGSSKGPGSGAAPSSREQRAAAEQRGPPDQEEDEDQAPQEQQREQQQLAPGAKRRRSTAAAAGGGGKADATIDALSAEAMQEVFLNIGQEQQSYCRCGAGSGSAAARLVKPHAWRVLACRTQAPALPARREILPLVCKRFRDVLLEPSCVWEVSTQLPSRTHCTRPAPTSGCHSAPAGDSRLASAFRHAHSNHVSSPFALPFCRTFT